IREEEPDVIKKGQLSIFDLFEDPKEHGQEAEGQMKTGRLDARGRSGNRVGEQSIDRRKDRKAQEAILKLQEKYGKNVVMKGIDLEEGATQRERNRSIGGHKA
ncbi:MAG: hypothetical protein PUE94_05835, partial [Lachnospiraceae bacterium]|nr:hypothetical protein [Lachnospiraceae bacterium]